MATLDQRGTGTSYPALDPSDTYTLESAIADTVATTNYLQGSFRRRSRRARRAVLGHHPRGPHGPPGTDAVLGPRGRGPNGQPSGDRPHLLHRHPCLGTRARGKSGLATELEEIGPPPYTSMLQYETALSFEQEVYPYDHTGNSEGAGGFSENFLVPEYSFVDQVHLLAGFMDTFGILYPRIQDVDLRQNAPSLEVPVFFVQGAHEAPGRSRAVRTVVRGAHRPDEGNGRVRPLRSSTALRATRRVRRLHDHSRAARYPLRSSRAASGRPLQRLSRTPPAGLTELKGPGGPRMPGRRRRRRSHLVSRSVTCAGLPEQLRRCRR